MKTSHVSSNCRDENMTCSFSQYNCWHIEKIPSIKDMIKSLKWFKLLDIWLEDNCFQQCHLHALKFNWFPSSSCHSAHPRDVKTSQIHQFRKPIPWKSALEPHNTYFLVLKKEGMAALFHGKRKEYAPNLIHGAKNLELQLNGSRRNYQNLEGLAREEDFISMHGRTLKILTMYTQTIEASVQRVPMVG